LPGTITPDEQAPIIPDKSVSLPPKIQLKKWISERSASIASSSSGFAPISDSGEFKVICYAGSASNALIHLHHHGEAWIWQWKGSSTVTMFQPSPAQTTDDHTPYTSPTHSILLQKSDTDTSAPTSTTVLTEQDSFLIPLNTPYQVTHNAESVLLVITMVPKARS
jgi:hypothetical protein